MDPVHLPFTAAALLVIAAGVTKVRDPFPTHRALRQARWPSTPSAVRLLALVEIVVGVAALTTAGGAAAALAVLYAAFTVFVLLALVRRLPLSSCGCFGHADQPPSFVHVAIDVAALASAAVMAADGLDAPLTVLREARVGDATALAAGSVALAAFAAVTLGAGRSGPSRPRPHGHRR